MPAERSRKGVDGGSSTEGKVSQNNLPLGTTQLPGNIGEARVVMGAASFSHPIRLLLQPSG